MLTIDRKNEIQNDNRNNVVNKFSINAIVNHWLTIYKNITMQ